ncbi:MAG: LysR family transcriptional regulator, partial [Bifidobacterium crudilactis]|nr:LysR family transcriptional regulator [Bifidobacterium crudilactis]
MHRLEASLELRVLRYFLAVVEERNISHAAESMFVSQPTISRQLRDLEEELGVTLFQRGSRTIALTEA